MQRAALVAALALLAAGCPKIEKTVYTFDLAAKTGSVQYLNITSDDPDHPYGDFQRLVATAIDGTQVEDQHPGWKVTSKELTVEDGKLNGVVRFTFDTPAAAGIYKHDKKSPYIWCYGANVNVVDVAGGEDISDVLPGCAAWDRKASRLQVTIQESEMTGNEISMVPAYEAWKKGETPPPEGGEAETPAPETPEAEAPAPETPEAETPEADKPDAETPETRTPETPAPAPE